MSDISRQEGMITGSEVDLFVHPLEHKSLISVLFLVEGQHPLGAIDVSSLGLQEVSHELIEQNGVEVAVDDVAHRGDER